MERFQGALPFGPSPDEVQNGTLEPVRAMLMSQHEQAVTTARLEATASYGSAASRKRHAAWKAAEARFAASLARVVPERIDSSATETAI